MTKHYPIKVASTLLLSAGLVTNVLNISQGATQTEPNKSVATLAKSIKSKKDIVKKHDYLPDILGRIGHAIFNAEQTQIENIKNYQLPDVKVTYSDGTSGFIRHVVDTIRHDMLMNAPKRNEVEPTLPKEPVEEPEIPIVDEVVEEPHEPTLPEEPIVDGVLEEPELPIVDNEPPIEDVFEEPELPEVTITDDEIFEEPILPHEPPIEDVFEDPTLPEEPIINEEPPTIDDVFDEPELPEEPIVDEIFEEPELPIVDEESPIIEDVFDEPELPQEPPVEEPILPDEPPIDGMFDEPELPEEPIIDIEPPIIEEPTLPDEPPVDELPDMPDELPDFPDELPDMPDMTDELPDEIPGWELPDEPDFSDNPIVNNVVPEKPIVKPTPEKPITNKVTPEKPESTNPDEEVKTRQETVKIKQGQKIVYDITMEKGTEKLVEGTPGQVVKTYKDTYLKGELTRSTLVEETATIQPISDILYIGSKVSENATRIVDIKVGDKLNRFEVLNLDGDIQKFVGKNYDELIKESEDDRFAKAISTLDASYIARDPNAEEDFDQTYMWLGVGDEMVTVFNSTDFVDKTKVNEYLVHYINADRELKGLDILTYDPKLQVLTEVRAQEMADYGHIRFKGKPHTRPDGTPWLTVLDQLPTDYKSSGFGENMLAYSILSNPYQLTSEQWIAKRLFEQWKSSPTHYASMMDTNYTRTAVSFKLTTRTGAKSENNTNWMIGAELFS